MLIKLKKSLILFLIILTIGSLCSAADAAGISTTALWPMLGGNEKHNKLANNSLINFPGIKWSYVLNQPTSPIIINSDGTLYFVAYDKVYAINTNGTLKWVYGLNGFTYYPPVIDEDGTIYVGNYDGGITALNPDGTLKWSGTGSGYSSPVIGPDGTIYSGKVSLIATNPDGTLKWQTDTLGVLSSPAIGSNGTIYVGSGGDLSQSKLYAFNADGTVKWSFQANAQVLTPTISNDGNIYFGSLDDRLYCVDADGNQLWSYIIEDISGFPAIGPDGEIYIGNNSGELYAINVNGTLKWKFTGDSCLTAPIVSSDGIIYVGSNSSLYAINSNGTLKWDYKKLSSIPVIGSDGTIYISSYNYLLALEEDTSSPTGSVTINGGITQTSRTNVTLSLPASDNGIIAFMQISNDGVTWTQWEPYKENKEWTLSTGDGNKTVYVQFKDAAGHVSEVYSDTITLNTINPVVHIINPSYGIITNNPNPVLNFDTISGIVSVLVNGNLINVASGDNLYSLNEGENTVKVELKDSSDNIIGYDEIKLYLDTTSPIINGVTNGGTYKPIVITFNEGTATINGNPYTSGTTVSSSGNYILVVTDVAGNSTTVNFTIDAILPVITVSPGPGIYNYYPTVEITTDDPSATIYYSIDGSEPNILYTAPWDAPTITSTCSIKIKAVDSIGNVATVTYDYVIDVVGFEGILPAFPVNNNLIIFSKWDESTYITDLYKYSITNQSTTRLTTNANVQQIQAYGDYVVWSDGKDVYLLDLVTNVSKKLTSTGTNYNCYTNGVYVAWVNDDGNGNYSYVLYNIADNSQQVIHTTTAYPNPPKISGNLVVWPEDVERNDTLKILKYSISSGGPVEIAYDNPDHIWIGSIISIDKGFIYTRFHDAEENDQIGRINPVTGILTGLTSSTGSKYQVRVYDGKVTFQKDDENIYLLDGTNEILLAEKGINQEIYGNIVTYGTQLGRVWYTTLPSSDTTPPTVTASPNGGTYNSAQTVTLTADEPADIYYTLDGSDPTTASTLYTAPITIDSTTTLKFMAIDRAGNQSSISTTNYTIQYPTQLAYTGLLSAVKDSTVTLSANLTAANGGPSDLSGREIIFTLGSQTVSAFTDATGNATAALTLNQAASNYPLTVTYNGDAALLGSTYAGTFYITAGNSNNVKPNVSMDPVVVTPDANGQTYTATITGTVDQGAAVEVSVSINHGNPIVYQAVVNGTTWSYTIANLAKNDQVKIEAIAKDAVGNTSLPAKDNFKVR